MATGPVTRPPAAAMLVAGLENRWILAAGALAVGALVGLSAGVAPEATWGLVAGPIVAAAILAALFRCIARRPDAASMVPLAATGVVLRAGLAIVHIIVGLWVYGGAIDFMGYIEAASFTQGAWVVTFVATMMAVVGPNVVGLFMVCVAVSTTAAYLYIRAYEIVSGAPASRFLQLTFFLLPAVAFWSVFLGKDVWVFFGMALATYAFANLLRAITVRHLALALIGGGTVFVIRAPVAAALCLAMGAAYFTRPLRWQGWAAYLRPVVRVAAVVALAGAGSVVMSSVFVKYGVQELTLEGLAERAYLQHQGFAYTEAGSQLPVVLMDPTPAAVAAYLPLGMFTLFFRPFPWEAHNALALAASVENVFLLGVVVMRLPYLLRSVWRAPRQPFMLFVLAALVLVALSLAFQWNFGTMARMRTMALPFLVFALAGPVAAAGSEDRT